MDGIEVGSKARTISDRPKLIARLTSKLTPFCYRFFHISEIASDRVLQWMAGAIVLGFCITFAAWINEPSLNTNAIQDGSYRCWPIFQDCANYIWLTAYPNGYSQTTIFMCLFGIGIGCAYCTYARQWMMLHGGILILFLAKCYFMFISYRLKGNYDYYHNVFCLIYLFFPFKRFFLQLSIVFFYFLSTIAKIHPSWVLGTYFSTLRIGLPLFPLGSEILATNVLMFMEMVGAWFLFSSNLLLQRVVFGFFCVFHIYSGILVGFRYPATVLPPLIILFGPWFKAPAAIPWGLKSLPGWALLALLTVGQMIPVAIKGDQKLTLEGNYYGLYMFDANHQCFGSVSLNGKRVREFSSGNALVRCDPYDYYSSAKHIYCRTANAEVAFIFSHSINGLPFKEIVNEANICQLKYKAFGHNAWIKTEAEAPSVGRPLKNFYEWNVK